MQSAVVFCCVASPHGNKSADLVTLVIFHMTNYARLRCLECQKERERGGAEREREGKGEGEARGNYSLWSGRAEERASAKVASCDKATANGPSVMQVPSPSPPLSTSSAYSL